MLIKYLPGDMSSDPLLRNLFRVGMHGSVKLLSIFLSANITDKTYSSISRNI